ncbi:hypothetical protein COL26b_013260 [Colletotrichum chrysophilum]|uniref:uncharacterized protein n=1 Tax=Colletotrichum chrysophilum TaxID=1836956 RepID=UPI00230072B3|nr:uncharacterized protein COL26b_013260 [Colletotrichum chrysophilum]KAJ0362693.1 hypothetical protein COL26b_013260 [Colletotrichum chrysophilum]
MSSEQSIPSPATSDCGGAIAQAESPDDLAVQMNHLALSPQEQHQDEILSSPLLTAPLINKPPRSKFGLFGAPISEDSSYVAEARLFHNGSGKSNTLACLLENCLIPSQLGKLPYPLTGIVFHYDSFVSNSGGLPCEAAFIASHEKESVRVLYAPTNVRTIQSIYSNIPHVKIEPLKLSDDDLNTRRMNDLMAVGEGSSKPLYMQVVNRI